MLKEPCSYTKVPYGPSTYIRNILRVQKVRPQVCMSKKPSISLVRVPPPCSPTGSVRREVLCLQNQWFIHSFLFVRIPKKNPLMKCGEDIQLLFMEPHTDGKPTYSGVQPGSTRGSLTLLSLPQCHAAFSMIPSTWAWVASMCHSNFNRLHLLPPLMWPRVEYSTNPRNPEVQRGAGFMGGRGSGSVAVDGVSGSHHAPATLSADKNTGTHWIWGLLGPRASLHVEKKS
jgi:hypothetical protein